MSIIFVISYYETFVPDSAPSTFLSVILPTVYHGTYSKENSLVQIVNNKTTSKQQTQMIHKTINVNDVDNVNLPLTE